MKISAQTLNSDAMATTATTAAIVTSVNGSDGGVKSIQIKNFFKKGDMKEVAVTLCDELFKEVQSVKGK